jgi:filamentous hemagglutinin family protein
MKMHLSFSSPFIFSIGFSLAAIPLGIAQAVDHTVVTAITLDHTLSGVSPLVDPIADPSTGGHIQVINEDNGKAAGSNLFYSFGQFDVGKGDTAYFNLHGPVHADGSPVLNTDTNTPVPWENVVARVTGGMTSFIDGTLRVSGSRVVDGDSSHNPDNIDGIAGATTIENGAKNFFLINPDGIVFGHGSLVDVPGSFYASNASTLKFKDDFSYGVAHGTPTPEDQLTSTAPAAFGFLGDESGVISLDNATIQVFNDETLALVGRDVSINNSKVGQVDLTTPQAGFNASGLPLDPNNYNQADRSSFPRFVAKGDLFIDGIQLLLMANHSEQDVKILANDPSYAGNNAAVTQALKLDGDINISNTNLINAGGDAEEITLLRGGNINLTNASIVSSNYGDDCGGICTSDQYVEPTPGISGIDILATGNLTMNNGHVVTETVFLPVNPATDNVAINIQAASMLMDHGSTISTKSLDVADINRDYVPANIFPVPHAMDPQAGNIHINVVDEHGHYGNFTAQGGSSVESSTETFGNAGKIDIEAGSITLNHASIKSESTSTHNGLTGYLQDTDPDWKGDIKRASDANGDHFYGRTTTYVLLTEDHTRYDLLSHDEQHPELDAPFDPNNPAFTTSAVRPEYMPLVDPMFLIDHNKDAGAAGSVTLTAHNGDITLSNDSTISTNIASGTNATESAKISLNAGSGSILLDGSKVTSTTSGDANAGNVELSAAHSIAMNNLSKVTTDTVGANDGKTGAGGEISTHSNALAINSGSFISSSTNGLGAAGNVSVNAQKVSIAGVAPIAINQLGRYVAENFTGIRTIADHNSDGQTGNINIHASGNIRMTNGAQLSISNLANSSNPNALHKTHIDVDSSGVYLTNSQIVADSTGNVDAGEININFKDWLKLDPSAISTIANNGNGGAVNIGGGNFIWLQDSEITTSVLGANGNGGDIGVTADYLIMDSGFIQANTAAEGANGGLVNIDVGALIPSGGVLFMGGNSPYQFQPYSGINVIQAAAPDGVSGQINATSPQLNLSGTLANLIVPSFDSNEISRNSCRIDVSSSLSQAGKGGLRRRAKDPLLSTYQF